MKIQNYCLLGLVTLLASCGGGGSSISGSSSTANADTQGGNTDPYADLAFDKAPPATAVIQDSMSFALSLSDRRDDPFVRVPPFDITAGPQTWHEVPVNTPQLDLDIATSATGGYLATIRGGLFPGASPDAAPRLSLPSAIIWMNKSSRALQGFNTTQFEGSAAVAMNSTPSTHAYALSIQSLTDAGIGTVGMGNWKYLGASLGGYFPGIQNAHGAFLFGTPTAGSQVAAIPTGSYQGFAQAGAEAYLYDTFDQVAANASVHYDAESHVITIRLSNFNLRASSFNHSGVLNIQWNQVVTSQGLPDSVTCTGNVSTITGQFSCKFAGDRTGQIKGKFFGERGQVVAGTYSLSGYVTYQSNDILVGGFITQRYVTKGTTAPTQSSAPRWQVGPNEIVANEYIHNPTPITLQVTASSNSEEPIYPAILDAQGNINPDVHMAATGPNKWNLLFSSLASDAVQTRSGTLTLRLCYDNPLICARPANGSPWQVPYRSIAKSYPGPNPVFLPASLDGVTNTGQSLTLKTVLSLNEISVMGLAYGHTQYRFTVVDPSGILEPVNAVGEWSNVMPNGFPDTESLTFKTKSDLVAGSYDGKIKVSICGFAWDTPTKCWPVDRPTIEVPYHLVVQP